MLLEVTHHDVIPSTLLARIAGSLGPLALVVEAARDRVVAWVEIEPAAAPSAGSAGARDVSLAAAECVRARLGRGLVLALGAASVPPPGLELGFIEGVVHGLGGDEASVRVRGYLACDALPPAAPYARARSTGLTADLAVELSLLAGRTRLRVHDLRALARGDVITLDRTYAERVPAIAEGLDAPIWLEHRAGTFVHVVHEEPLTEPDETSMSRSPHAEQDFLASNTPGRGNDADRRLATSGCDELDELGELGEFEGLEGLDDGVHLGADDDPELEAHESADGFVEVDALVIDLSVEVARIATTVGELERLAVGAVLATGAPLGREVVLRSRGRRVAEGELVELEGELAVRITGTARSTHAARASGD